MKLTKFRRLRNAIANLDINFITNQIRELQSSLGKRGQPLEPRDTIVAEEAIYYIHPRSGMTTKVALYKPDLMMNNNTSAQNTIIYGGGVTSDESGTYHLMRCNIITRDEHAGWKDQYQIVQRLDDGFYCRLIEDRPSHKPYVKPRPQSTFETQIYEEVEDQNLVPCPYCLTKVNSLIGANPEYTQENFRLQYFFQSGFESTWMNQGKYSEERGAFADMYPKDWGAIVEAKLGQAAYVCEGCSFDMSEPHLQRYAHIHTSDYLRGKISYFHLRCLCMRCMADLPDGGHVQERPEYEYFLENYDAP